MNESRSEKTTKSRPSFSSRHATFVTESWLPAERQKISCTRVYVRPVPLVVTVSVRYAPSLLKQCSQCLDGLQRRSGLARNDVAFSSQARQSGTEKSKHCVPAAWFRRSALEKVTSFLPRISGGGQQAADCIRSDVWD